jgi:ligand-binding SRPBCC domain-containing protein
VVAGMIHYLHREQFIPASVESVWNFFADPRNLNNITPPDMNFEIVTGGDTPPMYEGQIIEYRVAFLRGLRSLWLTEISHVREGSYFVDEQRIGPYRFWYHEHMFEMQKGRVKMTDHVTYAVPLSPLGEVVHAFWIQKRLAGIFDFRRQKIIELFGAS